ncbi:integrase [Pseudoalteromonas ruthenica]|uniref:Integrase n=1 Tax=Pseudoalteromonas ruthenica TaxID=151081 RepID=A0A0F4PQG0_9GAMM|nr:integrase [Pseudoalteromonas ruthenica]KJY97647.1 integrase [Pseudoalteromonas ruthenica]KJZ01674.1 integrase [Pseudoalteromonas ruthenica]TMO94931.1 integrase [Pseudoalteromonas ruthenica]TMO97044.1 integrase [Pseudoalteromonas ruthenica]TMP06430.1 integrase [Pseudoalteromonas ruthenica]
MSNVVALLPRPGNDASGNLTELVAFYKHNSPFKSKEGWEWGNVYWDVKGICKTQARKAAYELLLYFNRDNQLGANVKTPRTEMLPFHHSELSDVTKCHVTALQIESEKDAGSLQIWINAYRYLDNVLSKSGKRVADISAHDFRLAELEAEKQLAASTFYRIGSKLEGICKFINQKGLARQKITFLKVAKRGETHTNSDSRIDQSSIDERAKKLPSKYSLIAVATLSNADLKGDDALFQSMVEIMFATGLRLDEVVSLDKDCLYEKQIEERNVVTGKQDVFTVHEIRYKAKKGAGFRTKTVADSLVPIVKKGIETALELLSPVREVIEALGQGGYDFFPQLDSGEEVTIAEAGRLLGWSSNSNFQTYLRKRNITINRRPKNVRGKASTVAKILPAELKDATADLGRESAAGLWNTIKKTTVADKLENMLYVTQYQRHHSIKSTEPWKFTLISHTQISDYIAGRPGLGVKSVFERHDLTFEDQSIRLTSHQFRHFLSTMLELCDTVSDIEVARYFGRKYIGDNAAYDHTNKTKKVMDHADDIIASTGISKEQAKEAAILFTLVDKEEALDTIGDLTTTLITSIGLCKHDYNDSPCGKHYACLRGCAEYYRIKGSKTEIDEVLRIREQQKLHVAAAKESVEEEFHNANNWLISHQELLDGCEMALRIENDESIALGERVQVFPEGKTKCEAI